MPLQCLRDIITQYRLVQGDFLTADYFLTLLFDQYCSCSFEISIITLRGRANSHNAGNSIASDEVALS